MIIKISDLEKKINRKLKRNYTAVGIDLATKTGYCVATVNNTHLKLDMNFINLTDNNEYLRYNQMIEIFQKLISADKFIVIEDTYYSRNFKTFKLLSRFGGIIYCISYMKNKYNHPIFINASSARKKIGIYPANCKKPVVKKWIINNLGINISNEDIVDAIVLALNGLLEEKYEQGLGKASKRTRKKRISSSNRKRKRK